MKKEKGKEEKENCIEHIQSDRELWSGVCILGTTILHHNEHNSCWSMCHSYTNTYICSYQNSVKAFMITLYVYCIMLNQFNFQFFHKISFLLFLR